MHHHVILSSRCQNRCKFCATGTLDYTLSSDNIIEFLDIHDGDRVLLTGGEPSLYKDFITVAKHVKECGGSVEILTNSIKFADKRFCDEMSGYIDSSQCSFYSWSKTITTYLTGNKNAYDRTISGIHNLIDAGVEVSIKTLVNIQPCYRTVNMTVYKIINEFGLDSLWLSGCDYVGRVQENRGLLVPLDVCDTHVDRAIELATSMGVEIYLMFYPLCKMSAHNASIVKSRPCADKIDFYLRDDVMEVDTQYDNAYGHECDNCILRDRCTGVWSKYMNLYNGGKI